MLILTGFKMYSLERFEMANIHPVSCRKESFLWFKLNERGEKGMVHLLPFWGQPSLRKVDFYVFVFALRLLLSYFFL